MPVVAAAAVFGQVSTAEVVWTPLVGEVQARLASIEGTVSRTVVESFSGLSLCYNFEVKLAGEWLPRSELVGPFEIEASIDTVVTLFTFSVTGRRWGLEATSQTWTHTPVEVWVTTGPAGALRGSLRAFGAVISCQQTSGPEPTLQVRCGDPSQLYAGNEICYELPAAAGLSRGAVCRQILADAAGLDADVPAGAVYRKPVTTDSARLWDWLAEFGEPESWSWRFRELGLVEAYTTTLRLPPEPPDDIWTLADVVSVETTPPAPSASSHVVHGSEVVEGSAGVTINKTRTEVIGLYAVKGAVSKQTSDGDLVDLLDEPLPERLQRISLTEVEEHTTDGKLVTQITREWGWYNPRAAKLRSEGTPPGPVDGYYFAEAYLDETGTYRAWRQEAWVQTGERREVPVYDEDGTELARRTETSRWYGRTMGTRTVGADSPTVIGAGVGDDDVSWFAFTQAGGLWTIEAFGLAQVDEVAFAYGDDGAVTEEVQETFAWYSARTAVVGVPWYVNYSGAGQKDLVAPFQLIGRRVTQNRLTDGLLAGTVETSLGWTAPRRVGGTFDWGDASSNSPVESFATIGIKTTSIRAIDESSYEEVVDIGSGASSRLVMGRVPRPRYRSSSWTALSQQPFEVVLQDPVAEVWWGTAPEVLTLDVAQTQDEAISMAARRRARKSAFVHTVVRPVCGVRPGDTVLLIDPRSGVMHRCLVVRLAERWQLAPRPQILATYTLEQPV